MKLDVFVIFDEEKMNKISNYFVEIMDIFGFDLEDDLLGGIFCRVVKMFVKEIFYGLDLKNKFKVLFFENKFGYC